MSTTRSPDVGKRFRLKTVTKIDESCDSNRFYHLLSPQVRLRPKFVYEIGDFVYENFVSVQFRIRNDGARWTGIPMQKPDFVSKPYETKRKFVSIDEIWRIGFRLKSLRLQAKIRLGWENSQAADFVLTRIRHTKFPFVYENSASLGFRIRIPWISYTKSGFRIRNFHFVVRNRRRNSSPGPKIGTTRNIVYDFSSPKVDFVYEIHGFRIRNSYTKKSRLRLFVGGGDTI